MSQNVYLSADRANMLDAHHRRAYADSIGSDRCWNSPRAVRAQRLAAGLAMGKPPFARDRQWIRRASKAYPAIDRRVWFDPESGYEYDKDPNPAKGTWHEIDARRRVYREIDPETGAPIQGSEGEWRPLR